MRLQFDNLILDSETRQLWMDGGEVRLSTKAFALLALLVAHRPHAVAKTDIRAQLWPGTVVSESSLPSLVSEIREAIADHRRKPASLRTLHGFGYAFQAAGAPVNAVDNPDGNGTYVNDRRISEPTPIADGDQIRIGSLLFTFRLAQDAASTLTQASGTDTRSRS